MEDEGGKRPRRSRRNPPALLVAGIGLAWLLAAGWSIGIAPATQDSPVGAAGDVARGRSLFNGKGVCFYCHGLDAHPDRLPQLAPDTAAYVAHLDPKPPHLREPKGLKIAGDKERFQLIREGHVGTGMLPDASLSDQDIHDLLAYLASLRSASEAKGERRR